jgi:type I restriction enzyme, S subunit
VKGAVLNIGDFCTTTQGVQITKANTSEKPYDGGYRYLYIADFMSDDNLSYVDDEFDSKKVTKNDLVMANTGSPGRVFKGKNGILSNNLFKITFDQNKVDRDYLFMMLSSDLFQNVLQTQMKGGIQKHLGHKTIARQEIPLPPLPEQQKIASILDAADSLRQKDQQLIEKYNALNQSLFLEMFGDPETNPMGWDVEPFDYFASIDTQMTTDFLKYANVPHIGIANIEKNTGMLINYRLVKDENLTSGKYIFTPEHIIYSKIRPNLNKVALPNFNGLSSADSYPILVHHNKANKLFFTYILRSAFFLDFILQHSTRTNIPKANKSQMRLFKGIAPPISLQNKFGERIQSIEAQKQLAQTSLEKSEALFNSLLQRAFKGELTT